MTSNTPRHESRTGEAHAVEENVDREKLQRATQLLLEAVGADTDATPYAETWKRRVPDLFTTLTEGNREAAKPSLRTFEADTDELIVKTDIPVYSLCEHHLLPFHGVAHVGYLPGDEIVGLSKIPRYVRWRARQFTTQERLTDELATGFAEEIDATAVVVQVTATHLCEAMRGVETETRTTTRSIAGELTERDRERFQTAIDNA